MKILILLLTILFLQNGFAKELSMTEKSERSSLSIRMANYADQVPQKMRFAILADLEKFSLLDLTEKNDIELIKNVLQTLLLIDEMDSPRTGVLTVSDSYGHYKKLYIQAALSIETAKNKNLLQNLLQVMDDFYQHGNG